MTIVEFLTARLDETGIDWHELACGWAIFEGLTVTCACEVPKYIMADIAAKRAIVRRCDYAMNDYDAIEPDGREFAEAALQHLAAPYSDHPDYRQEWKP